MYYGIKSKVSVSRGGAPMFGASSTMYSPTASSMCVCTVVVCMADLQQLLSGQDAVNGCGQSCAVASGQVCECQAGPQAASACGQ